MDIHFNGYKVKYQLMDTFFKPIKSSQNIKSLNIFINLDDLFHTLHRPLINNEFQVCGLNAGKQLLSNLFNILGHYRYWAIKQGLHVKVYGIYTSAIRSFKNNMYILDYRKKFKNYMNTDNTSYFFINSAIKACFPLLPVISKYIPNVYMIDSKYLEPSIIPLYISENVFSADWNILISRDTYDIQYGYDDKWSLISPKGDNSKLITTKNVWEYLNDREHIYKDPVHLTYDYRLYNTAKAIVGDKYRNIPRLKKIGWITLFKYLDKIKEKYEDCTIVTMQTHLVEMLTSKNVSIQDINNNLYAVNVKLQINSMMEIDRTSITTQLEDVPDYENLKMMNAKDFMKFPLNLNFLCNEVIPRTPFG